MKKIIALTAAALALPQAASAHCPLCTAGAGALALLAAYLGISSMIIGVLIGAFALALGMWIAKMPKRQYVKGQYYILTLVIFLSTVIPVMPLVRDYAPLYVSFIGEYGTTYAINLFLAGVPIGAFILWATPYLSRLVSKWRGKTMPYQGITLTLVLLALASVIIQLS